MRSSPAPTPIDAGAGNFGTLKPEPGSRSERIAMRLPWWTLLLAITAGGLALRLHNLGTLSLWVDEGYSARAITHSYAYLWGVLPKFEFNPPAYYIILKAWTALLGMGDATSGAAGAAGAAASMATSEASLRLPSVIFSVATIPVVFLIGRTLGSGPGDGDRTGLFAAGLFALSALQLQYAQDARSYALLALVVALAALTALRIMRGRQGAAVHGGGQHEGHGVVHDGGRDEGRGAIHGTVHSEVHDGGRAGGHGSSHRPSYSESRSESHNGSHGESHSKSHSGSYSSSHGADEIPFTRWALLGVLLGFIPWIHHTGVVAVFALSLPLAYWWLTNTRRDRKVLRGLLLAAAIAALLLVPDVFTLLGRAADVHRGYWIQKPDAGDLLSTLLTFAGVPFTSANEGVAALVLLLAAAGLRDLWAKGGAGAALLLLSLGLVPPLTEIAVSYGLMPVFLPRTFLYASVPLALLAGRGIESLPGRYQLLTVITLAPLLCLNAAGYFESFSKEPWRDIVSHLSAKTRPGQPVFYTNTSPGWVMPYYAERQRAHFVMHGVPFRQADFWRGERDDNMLQDTGRGVEARDIDRVRELLAGHPRVGVLLKGPAYSDPGQLLVGEVKKEFQLADQTDFPGGITVLIFDRR